MAYDYDDAERYEGRILWGRIAVLAVVLVLVFALGTWWGGRGATDEDQIVELRDQVEALQEENRELQDTVDALSAGEGAPEPEPADNADAEGGDEADGNEEVGEAEEPSAEPRTYLVQPGDTLRGIARDVYGDPDKWDLIAEANGLTRETVLTVGQELVIPPDGGGDA